MSCFKRRLGLQFILVAFCAFFCLPQASLASIDSASEPTTKRSAEINKLDSSLLLELIKFSRFSIHFHLQSNYHQKWRAWTYPLGREAGTAATFGGTLTDITQQAKGLSNLRNISRSAIKNGMASSMTGNAISGSSSSLELAQNTWVMWKARRNGFSPGNCINVAKQFISTTDALFDKRQQLIGLEQSPAKREVHKMESDLLKRIRQQLLFEFSTWSIYSREQAWRENTFYTIDAADSFTRMTAVILARRALDEPRVARSAAICGLIANSALTLNPIVSNLTAYAVRKYQKHKLARQFSFQRPDLAEDSLHELKQMRADYPGEKSEEQLAVLIDLGARSGRLDAALDRESKEIARYRQIAQQQSIVGPAIGLTALASSILSTVAIYDFHDKPVIANRLGFSGRISHSTGQVAALLITPYTAVHGMLLNKRLKSRGELPAQILEQRLARLDHLEKQITTTQP